MARLSIQLLGPFAVTLEEEPVTDFESDKVRALLAFLATEPDRPHRREALAGLLWPERPERIARRNLRHALAQLRLAIGDCQGMGSHLLVSRQTIQLNSGSDAWCDVIAFNEPFDRLPPTQQTIPQLEEAAALYTGPFLEGFSIGDSVPFGEWLLVKREQFQHRALSALHRLAVHYEALGNCEAALAYAWRQVELEPWREEAHRQLMRLLALNGQRGVALAQYEACRRALEDELQVAPARETTMLYEAIRDGTMEPSSPIAASVPSPGASASSSLPAGQTGSNSRWRSGRYYILAGALLLTAFILAALYTRPWEGLAKNSPASDLSIAAQLEEGKLIHLCEEDSTRPQLCLLELDTGRRAHLTGELAFTHIAPIASWSPDGRQIVFAAGQSGKLNSAHNLKLYVIGADGSGLQQLTDDNTNEMIPAWSPDGRRIAYHRGGELWLIRPDGSQSQRLLGQPLQVCVGGLAWSPDGRQLAFLNGRCNPNRPAFQELAVIGRDGAGLKVIHRFDQALVGGDLAWSPDGREIVCQCFFSDLQEELLKFDAGGQGEPQRVDRVPFSWFANFWPQWLEET